MFFGTEVSEKIHQPARLKGAGWLSEDYKIGKWGQNRSSTRIAQISAKAIEKPAFDSLKRQHLRFLGG